MVFRVYSSFLLAVLLFFIAESAAAQNGGSPSADPMAFTSSNLPIIVINTHGQSIPDEPKIPATMGIIYKNDTTRNYTTELFNHYNGPIGIETRGSSSQMYPKKQYGIETRTVAGEDSSVSLLGMPAEADWVLAAAYNDKSLMRDVLAFKLANSIGRYASRSKYCEVILNGNYIGVYILFEKLKRDKNRVNISKMTTADTTGDNLTGGYIFKVDKTAGADVLGWTSSLPPLPGATVRAFYQYDYPKQEDILPVQRAYLVSYMNNIEWNFTGSGYADPVNGYPKYLDVDSFVDMAVLDELIRNVDSYRLSLFLTKDKDSKGGKLTAGPLWDENLGFGNCNFYDAWKTEGWQIDYLTKTLPYVMPGDFPVPNWWRKLYDDPNFTAKIRQRWNSLRQGTITIPKMYAFIDSIVTHLSEAQPRNFAAWPKCLGSYVDWNYYVGKNYTEEIVYLKQWIASRVAWLDLQHGTTAVDDEANGVAPAACELLQNYPNPFNPTTTFRFRVPAAGRVRLTVHDILGRELALVVDEEKQAGSYTLSFNASNLPSGTYFYTMTAGTFTASKKMVLVR